MTNKSRSRHQMKILIITVACYIILGLTGFSSTMVEGKESSTTFQEKQDCVDQLEESAAALTAEDWAQLDTIARHLIQSCNGVLERRSIASAYGSLAIANHERGQFQEALAAAQSGIATHYLVTENHVEKFRALLSLHRYEEARNSYSIAKRLIQEAIVQSNLDLSKASDESDRKLYLSRNNNYQAQMKFLEPYRSRFK
jgi:tetratricopeptide (TPR) repeat protein